jgi:hypothetical protein
VSTLAIAAGALILLSGHRRIPRPAAGEPGRTQLIALLGALRRPQTSAGLHSAAVDALLATYNPARAPWDRFGRPDLPLIRQATVTSWGEGVFLIPVGAAADRHQEGLLVMLGRRRALDCCATATDVQTGAALMNAGEVIGRGTATTRFLVVVPDGVTRVDLRLPWSAAVAGGPIAPRYIDIVAHVHNNVAAVQVNRQCCGEPPTMVWFGSGGNVIRRIGDLVGSYRSVALSPPGPETGRSRAAEREPDTPNPVWVTPLAGARHTVFSVHFRVLRNAADYQYELTGPCSRSIGTAGHPDDSRGATWSDHVQPLPGKSWCPGTYRLSVAVTDLGPFGALNRRAKPFGTATFTVR